MKKFAIIDICVGGAIAALYVLLTLVCAPFAFGPIQLRISEGLTILPVLFSSAVPGLFVGCLIANFMSPYGLWDIIIGSLLTLIAAIFSRLLKKNVYLATIPPILLNALGLPLLWLLMDSSVGFIYNFSLILATQALFVYLVGIPLHYAMKKLQPKIYRIK